MSRSSSLTLHILGQPTVPICVCMSIFLRLLFSCKFFLWQFSNDVWKTSHEGKKERRNQQTVQINETINRHFFMAFFTTRKYQMSAVDYVVLVRIVLLLDFLPAYLRCKIRHFVPPLPRGYGRRS